MLQSSDTVKPGNTYVALNARVTFVKYFNFFYYVYE